MIHTQTTFKEEDILFLTNKNKKFLHSVRKMDPKQFSLAALKDIDNIKNGLSICNLLKNKNVYDILSQCINASILETLKNTSLYFDHVGLEVFGSLNEYAIILENSSLHQGSQFKLFESVQFYKILKQYDQKLRKIDILRIKTKNESNIELFSCHQHYSKTILRESNVDMEPTKDRDGSFPLAHIAICIEDSNVFKKLVQTIEKSSVITVFGEGIYYNPGDHSYNMKLIMKKPLSCTIEKAFCFYFLEFISYS